MGAGGEKSSGRIAITRKRPSPCIHARHWLLLTLTIAVHGALQRSIATINEATDRIMAAITALVEEVRGETAPAERFDMRKAGGREIGNPGKKDPKKGTA